MRNCLSDHWPEILGPDGGQVNEGRRVVLLQFALKKSTRQNRLWHDGNVTIGKGKRPRDSNQLAKLIVDLSTGQATVSDPCQGKNPAKVAAGHLGGLAGGKARADNLSKKRKTEIAKQAATARWQKRPD
jgi:hypothetical protein